jgi:probable F420-dependent oxidoreductase
MEYGVQLANLEPARIRDLSQAAEGLGFDCVLFPDHIVSEGPERQYDPHAFNWDMIAIAASVAGATKKIRIGHLVLCNLFRHPAITAQSLTTLDHLSGGRLIAGLGSGWTETEFRMTGIPFPPITERLRMLDEALTCIKSLWANEQTTFDGEFYKLRDAILWPKPVQQPHPPIIVGGGGKGLLRIAAKHAGYLNIIPDAGKPGHISLVNARKLTADSYRSKAAFVREEATRRGRNPDAIKISSFLYMVQLTDSREATRKTAEMIGGAFGQSADDVLGSPMMLIGTPDDCVAELKRRVKEWGISQCIFPTTAFVDEAGLRRLHEQVIAHV